MSFNQDLKILLVEDASVMRQMEKKALNSLGITKIVEAADGREAIEKLRAEDDIDLIISDWNMPVMNGLELLQWVRGNEPIGNLPFMMATGRGEKKEIAKAGDAGVSSFISKPFSGDELKEKIEEALGLRDASDAADFAEQGPRFSENGKLILRVAHIQITDHLVLGVLKHMIQIGKFSPEYFELETECMSSWNPVAKALEQGSIDAACVLAPIAMDLFGHGVPVQLIMLAHKNGSIFVRNKKGEYKEPYSNFFKNKTFYIPHFQSIHHMLAHQFFDAVGLKAGMPGDLNIDVGLEVVPPVRMPQFLAENADACGYMVAEPLGTKAIAGGIAELQFFSSELWENHPCCVVAMQKRTIEEHEEAVLEFSRLLVEAGKFIQKKPDSAAEIAVQFLDPDKKLGLRVPLLKNVLTEPLGITTGDLYPVKEDLNRIQHYMHDQMGIGKLIDIDEFVNLRFADQACTDRVSSMRRSVAFDPAARAQDIIERQASGTDEYSQKTRLNLEGKYLIFTLDNQDFGVDILQIREIIKMAAVRAIPHAPDFINGIINFRDQVIPVIDLRKVFNFPDRESEDDCRMIILEMNGSYGMMQMAVIVDMVSRVTDIKTKDIDETPHFGVKVRTDYILAMAKQGSSLIILLNIDHILTQQESVTLEQAYQAAV